MIDQFPFIPLRFIAILIHPLEILLIWFVAGIVNRVGDFAIERSVAFWETQHLASDLQRRSPLVTSRSHH